MKEDVIAKMVLPRIKVKNKEKAVIFLAGLRLYEGCLLYTSDAADE